MKHNALLPPVLAFIYIVFSALFILGNYQDLGGDFGQYVIHARNLLLRRSWDHLLIGNPSVSPAYSLMLALVTWGGGVNAYYYGLLNSLFWSICAILSFSLYKNEFKSAVTAYVFFIALLFSPYILYFQQRGLPNIFYAMCTMLALHATKRLSKSHLNLWLVVCVLLPAFVRTEALALYAALFLYFGLRRDFKLLTLPLLGGGILLVQELIISLNFDLVSNFHILVKVAENKPSIVGGGTGDLDIISLVSSIISMMLNYIFNFSDFVATPRGGLVYSILKIHLFGDIFFRARPMAIALTFIASCGVLLQRDFRSADKIFFVAHIAVLSCFLLDNAQKRYLLPLVPIFLFYFVLAIEWLFSRLRMQPLTASVLTGLLILTPLFAYIPKIMEIPEKRNALFTAEMNAVADWIAKNGNGRDVAYFRPRLMSLLLDLRSTEAKQSLRLPGINGLPQFVHSGSLLVINKDKKYKQREILDYLRNNPEVTAIWEDKEHAIFAQKKSSPQF